MIYDIIIIGGGLNGILSLKYFKEKKFNVILLEKKSYLLSFLYDYMHDDLIFITEGYKIGLSNNTVSVKYLKKNIMKFQ